MEETMNLLIKNDARILDYYKYAVNKWKAFLSGKDINIESLAKFLSDSQLDFEHKCGSRWVGQKIMILSIFYLFYSKDTGFSEDLRDKAGILREGFAKSSCSLEVKDKAEKMADFLRIPK